VSPQANPPPLVRVEVLVYPPGHGFLVNVENVNGQIADPATKKRVRSTMERLGETWKENP
jgi:hypothetical protein